MNGWMDARQGNPVRTPARATLAGATDDDACMVHSTMRLRPSPHRCLGIGKVFVLVHIKIWIGILMYEKSSMMLTGFILLRQENCD